MSQDEKELGRIVERLVEALGPAVDGQRVVSVTWRLHSNDVGRVELEDGRVLMVKVGRFDWAAARFRAEKRAARWLNEQGIVAPRHLEAPAEIEGRPVLCYWRIELHTLATLWPATDNGARQSALREWGDLLRRVHQVPVDGCGPLTAEKPRQVPIHEFMERDLVERLRPGVMGKWPDGLASLDAAVEAVPELAERVGDARTVLLHGDPHAGNIMGRRENGSVSCEGMIDLETASGGPREYDLARALELHGPLFAQELPGGWFEELRQGYRMPVDPFALQWFAVYHLLNLGFYSALVGDHEHAAAVANAAAERARGLQSEV